MCVLEYIPKCRYIGRRCNNCTVLPSLSHISRFDSILLVIRRVYDLLPLHFFFFIFSFYLFIFFSRLKWGFFTLKLKQAHVMHLTALRLDRLLFFSLLFCKKNSMSYVSIANLLIVDINWFDSTCNCKIQTPSERDVSVHAQHKGNEMYPRNMSWAMNRLFHKGPSVATNIQTHTNNRYTRLISTKQQYSWNFQTLILMNAHYEHSSLHLSRYFNTHNHVWYSCRFCLFWLESSASSSHAFASVFFFHSLLLLKSNIDKWTHETVNKT